MWRWSAVKLDSIERNAAQRVFKPHCIIRTSHGSLLYVEDFAKEHELLILWIIDLHTCLRSTGENCVVCRQGSRWLVARMCMHNMCVCGGECFIVSWMLLCLSSLTCGENKNQNYHVKITHVVSRHFTCWAILSVQSEAHGTSAFRAHPNPLLIV